VAIYPISGLRHAFITAGVEMGLNHGALMSLSHHTSVATVDKYVVRHEASQRQRRSIQQLQQFLNQSQNRALVHGDVVCPDRNMNNNMNNNHNNRNNNNGNNNLSSQESALLLTQSSTTTTVSGLSQQSFSGLNAQPGHSLIIGRVDLSPTQVFPSQTSSSTATSTTLSLPDIHKNFEKVKNGKRRHLDISQSSLTQSQTQSQTTNTISCKNMSQSTAEITVCIIIYFIIMVILNLHTN